MEPVIIRTRDGLELVCYLSRPRDAQPSEPLPMVLRAAVGLRPPDTKRWTARRKAAVVEAVHNA